MKEAKVIAPGCTRCATGEKMVGDAVARPGDAVHVEKITNAAQIAMAGGMSTPGIVVKGMYGSYQRPARHRIIRRVVGGMFRTVPMVVVMAEALVAVPSLVSAQTLEIQPVTDGVWAIVGPETQRSAKNLADNATFGLVVTNAGAVLIDPGGSWRGAAALHDAIETVTDQPVKYVVDTGGQDHRWLGNGYWQAQGATIIASEDAVADQNDRASMQLSGLANFLGEQLAGTEPSYADVTFGHDYALSLGGVDIEIKHPGAAHTPGDSFVWVPQLDVVFTGDIVFVDRILGVLESSSITEWPATFEAMEATAAAHVVPGHGHATTMEKARADTYDYLMNLRARIGALIEEGGDIMDAPHVDQSAFSYLEQFDILAGRNAQTAFQKMEWE